MTPEEREIIQEALDLGDLVAGLAEAGEPVTRRICEAARAAIKRALEVMRRTEAEVQP